MEESKEEVSPQLKIVNFRPRIRVLQRISYKMEGVRDDYGAMAPYFVTRIIGFLRKWKGQKEKCLRS